MLCFLYFLSKNYFYHDLADYFGLGGSDFLPVINDLTEGIKYINLDKQYFFMGDSGFNCRDYYLVPFARE